MYVYIIATIYILSTIIPTVLGVIFTNSVNVASRSTTVAVGGAGCAGQSRWCAQFVLLSTAAWRIDLLMAIEDNGKTIGKP